MKKDEKDIRTNEEIFDDLKARGKELRNRHAETNAEVERLRLKTKDIVDSDTIEGGKTTEGK